MHGSERKDVEFEAERVYTLAVPGTKWKSWSRIVLAGLSIGWLTPSALSQAKPPIIDMHMHAYPASQLGPPPVAVCTPAELWAGCDSELAKRAYRMRNPPCDDPVWSPVTDEAVMTQSIDAMKRHDIYGVLSGTRQAVADWMAETPGRFFPGLMLVPGIEKFTHSVESLRELHAEGRLAVLGEVGNQYVGLAPDDPQLEPYWQLMEDLDVPVAIHIGPGAPGAPYDGYPAYRARMHSALTLEEVLVKHPNLRVYIMHAGYPMLDDLLALLYAHPQVYVDVGFIVWGHPRAAFYRYLQGIVEAGFGGRVMFGSDQIVWPGAIERSIATINDAPFLSGNQKRDILYNNAARFLRFSDEQIAKHHGR